MKFLTQKELNIIRGKASVGHATTDEIMSIFRHLDLLELNLDVADTEDFFGTEGWRRFLQLPDA